MIKAIKKIFNPKPKDRYFQVSYSAMINGPTGGYDCSFSVNGFPSRKSLIIMLENEVRKDKEDEIVIVLSSLLELSKKDYKEWRS